MRAVSLHKRKMVGSHVLNAKALKVKVQGMLLGDFLPSKKISLVCILNEVFIYFNEACPNSDQ